VVYNEDVLNSIFQSQKSIEIRMGWDIVRCLFCKQDSSNSKSVEHIIPESLGNTTSILSKGIVCDKCNNYFSRKIEQPFLESVDIKTLRFREAIPNKRGRIPPVNGILNGKIPVKIHNPISGIPIFAHEKDMVIAIESDNTDIRKIMPHGKIITPAFTDEMIPQNTTIISRFIAKVALESLAQKLCEHPNGIDYLIDESAYDPIRNYVRLGSGKTWPCSIRRIYDMDKMWTDHTGIAYQIVHESDFLLIPVDEGADLLNDNPVMVYPYFVLVLFGLEFAIYMADPDDEGLDMYKSWLHKHGEISPLHFGKNKELP